MALDRCPYDRITGRIRRKRKGLGNRGDNFLGRTTAVTDQERSGMQSIDGTLGGRTGYIGTDRGNPVRHTLAFQKLQRAIDGGRLGGLSIQTEAGDQVIRLDGFASRQEQFQNPAARCRHPVTIGQAALFGLLECMLNSLGTRSQL